jgi:pimeloyl-ACP methyl ester carboxylesterase
MGERAHLASADIGIETAIEDVLNSMKYNELQSVVLVGHSFAGKVVAAVADRVPERVARLIYLDAFRAKREKTPQGSFSDEWPVSGSIVPFPGNLLDSVGKDVQGTDKAWVVSMATPTPVRFFRDSITLTGKIDSVKKGYVFCTQGGDDLDAMLKEEGPYKDYKIEGPHMVIDAGHWPMVSKPLELAQDLLSLAGKS